MRPTLSGSAVFGEQGVGQPGVAEVAADRVDREVEPVGGSSDRAVVGAFGEGFVIDDDVDGGSPESGVHAVHEFGEGERPVMLIEVEFLAGLLAA